MDNEQAPLLIDALPLMPRETAFSYVQRLSAHYGCPNAHLFCRDFGISAEKVLQGDESTLLTLSRTTGCDAEHLLRWSIRMDGKKANAVRIVNGELLDHKRTSRSRLLFCPCCAAEDIRQSPDLPPDVAIYGRAEWQTHALTVCVVHEVKLVELRVRKHGAPWESGQAFSAFAASLEDVSPEPVAVQPFDHYFFARLTGTTHDPTPYLDDLPLYSAQALCRALGACLRDVRGSFERMEPALVARCETEGFEAFAGGDGAIEAAFREIRCHHWASQPPNGCLGRLALAFSRIPDVPEKAALQEALTAIAFRTFPFVPGEAPFGVPCKEPVLLRSHGARQRYAIGSEVWRDLVAATPAWVTYTDGSPGRTLIDVKSADAYFEGKLPFVSLANLAKRYGLTGGQIRRLLAVAIFTTIGINAKGRRAWLVSLPEASRALDTFFAEHSAALDAAGSVPDGYVSLADLSRRHAIDLATALEMIKAGRLDCIRHWRSDNPNEGIFVDPMDAISKIFGLARPVMIEDAARLLGLHRGTVRELADAGILPCATRNFVNGKKYAFDRAAIEEFKRTYATRRDRNKRGATASRRGKRGTIREWPDPVYVSGNIRLFRRADFDLAA